MNDVKKYEKAVRSLFPVYGKYEKRFFTDLKNTIAEYTSANEAVTFANLEAEFGSPANVISTYLSNVETDYLTKQLKRTKHIRFSCITVIVMAFIVLISWNIFIYTVHQDYENSFPASKDTTIIYYQ